METPFTSVVLCTRDRPAGFQRALASVLAQDTGNFDIVVVDGSHPPVELPGHTRVPLCRIGAERNGEGAARAAGLAQARGPLVAWCDDDAEWTPDHLRLLREVLLARPDADMACGWSNPATLRRSRSVWDGGEPPCFRLPAADVLHWAAAARRAGGFDPQLPVFAAGDLWSRIAEGGRVATLRQRVTMTRRAAPLVTQDVRAETLARLRRDWNVVAQKAQGVRRRLRAHVPARVQFNPATWTPPRRELHLQTITALPSSYAVVCHALVPALAACGVQVRLGEKLDAGTPPEIARYAASVDPQERLTLLFDYRTGPAALRGERVVCYTMWASGRVPPEQVAEINRAACMVYVPCHENVRFAEESGIEPPVRVLHHGVDGAQFPVLERPRRPGDPFTFGSTSVFNFGKGIDVLVRAFLAEFGPREPARLRLNHSHGVLAVDIPDDPRIHYTNTFLDRQGLLQFFGGLDAYVLPTRGEGFSLTGLEAMATGLPLIATNWSGPAEYLDPDDSYPLRFHLGQAAGKWMHGQRMWGDWAEPDIDHLRELLRWLFEHRDEAAQAGLRAAARMRRDWTWERVARQVIGDFDLLARGITPQEY